MRSFSVLFVLVLAIASVAVALELGDPTVVLPGGIVIGTTTSIASATATSNKYLGIPYAQSPPVRFAPPNPALPWITLNAKTLAPSCMQQFSIGSLLSDFSAGRLGPAGESEDCLYLNVFQPSGIPPLGGWPVMFWIYGGGLAFGTSNEPWYDGSSFASFENVIVVTFNYRLNVFGFPASPELPLTKRNLGYLDQRLALQWVQLNIKFFGGDPTKVTIFGESAGGISVDALITAPPPSLPFRAAIVQSGTVIGQDILIVGSNYTKSWFSLVQALGCTSAASPLACVRSAPATTLKFAVQTLNLVWGPAVDDVTYVSNGGASRSSGRAAKVPLLVGTNANEGSIFTYGQTNFTTFIASSFPFSTAVQKMLVKSYPVGGLGMPDDAHAIAQLFTEYGLQCPQMVMAGQSVAAGNPTWRYYYNATFPNLFIAPGTGAYHSSEIPLVFGNYPTFLATPQQIALSQFMRGAWAKFARNPTGGPGWNQLGSYLGTDLGVLGSFGSSGVTVVSPLATQLDFRCGLYAAIYSAVEATLKMES